MHTQRGCSQAQTVGVLVGEELQIIGSHLAVIKQHMVMGGAACPLQPRVADQEKVILCGVCDAAINHSACTTQPCCFRVAPQDLPSGCILLWSSLLNASTLAAPKLVQAHE